MFIVGAAIGRPRNERNNVMLLKNGKELTIRKAQKEDARELLAYAKKVGAESDFLTFGAEGLPYTIEQEEKQIENWSNSTSAVMLVGVVDGKIVTTCVISAPARERLAHQSSIAVSVLKEYWGIGIGSHMMNALIDFAKNSDTIELIHLGVHADNTSAIALYKKCGFQEIGRYPKFFKLNGKYYDEILMNLYL